MTCSLRTALIVLVATAAVGTATAPTGALPTGPPPKAIELTATPTSTVWSQATRLAFSITPKGGGPPKGGTVTFRAGDEVLGTAVATKRITTFSTAALPVGTHTLTATYGGDVVIGEATSDPVTVRVAPAASTTTLTGTAPTVPIGEPAELRAVVRSRGPAAAANRPTGTVRFTTDTGATGTVRVNATGVATWRPVLAEGSHVVTAVYSGSDAFVTSTSGTVTQVVAPPESTIDQDTSDTTLGFNLPPGIPAGQTFTAGRTGSLDRVSLWFLSSGEALGLTIRTVADGFPTDTVIGQGAGQIVNGAVEVVLDTPVAVEAGTTYAIVLTSPGALNARAHNADTYPGGRMMFFAANAWNPLQGFDLAFRTWVL